MNCTTPYKENSKKWKPFFFSNTEIDLAEYTYCKVYHDGSHHVAVPLVPIIERASPGPKKLIDERFDELYLEAVKQDISKSKLEPWLIEELEKEFPEEPELEEYVSKKCEGKIHNAYLRRKRFRRKAFLNPWTHFVTFTYNDELQSEESFRIRIKRTLANFAFRRGWRAMGVFEHAPDTGRLHYHGLIYIPPGQMVGNIREERSYSVKHRKMMTVHINDFFESTFGRNDFEELDDNHFSLNRTIDYILKYMEKTGERVNYSRQIPTELMTAVHDSNVVSDFVDYVYKMVLFDDVIDTDFDILDKGSGNVLAKVPFILRN